MHNNYTDKMMALSSQLAMHIGWMSPFTGLDYWIKLFHFYALLLNDYLVDNDIIFILLLSVI